MDWKIHQINIKVTFLDEVMEVKMYMDQLIGFVQEGEKHLVCKLKKICMDSSNFQGRGITVLTRTLLTRILIEQNPLRG
jgi:hypothetical protein